MLSPAISRPSYLPRSPGKFTALHLALTLGTLVWQIIKTKHTHSYFFSRSSWSSDRVVAFLQSPALFVAAPLNPRGCQTPPSVAN